jgi:hypothetical protein
VGTISQAQGDGGDGGAPRKRTKHGKQYYADLMRVWAAGVGQTAEARVESLRGVVRRVRDAGAGDAVDVAGETKQVEQAAIYCKARTIKDSKTSTGAKAGQGAAAAVVAEGGVRPAVVVSTPRTVRKLGYTPGLGEQIMAAVEGKCTLQAMSKLYNNKGKPSIFVETLASEVRTEEVQRQKQSDAGAYLPVVTGGDRLHLLPTTSYVLTRAAEAIKSNYKHLSEEGKAEAGEAPSKSGAKHLAKGTRPKKSKAKTPRQGDAPVVAAADAAARECDLACEQCEILLGLQCDGTFDILDKIQFGHSEEAVARCVEMHGDITRAQRGLAAVGIAGSEWKRNLLEEMDELLAALKEVCDGAAPGAILWEDARQSEQAVGLPHLGDGTVLMEQQQPSVQNKSNAAIIAADRRHVLLAAAGPCENLAVRPDLAATVSRFAFHVSGTVTAVAWSGAGLQVTPALVGELRRAHGVPDSAQATSVYKLGEPGPQSKKRRIETADTIVHACATPATRVPAPATAKEAAPPTREEVQDQLGEALALCTTLYTQLNTLPAT